MSGDTAVVGAFYDDTPAAVNAGSAYAFVRSGTVWTQQAKLTASDGAADDSFGYSVALSGDTAVVGANGDDTPAGSNAGSAYVFVRSPTVWTEQAKLTASDGAAYDNFGYDVALSGDTAVVGAPYDDTSAGYDAGSAYVFSLSPPALSIDDVSADEGDGGTTSFTFTVSMTGPSQSPVSVDYATADGTAGSPDDYAPGAGTLTFAPGETSKTLAVQVNGDTTFEPDETFSVNLSNPSGATIADGTGAGLIQNDDAQPSVSIYDVSLAEGDEGTTDFDFAVTLSNPSSQTVTVDYATADGTATAPSDYAGDAGTVTFGPGQTQKLLTVVVNGDFANEADETLGVMLSNPSNATIADGLGAGVIQNDDAQPVFSIDDVTQVETDSANTAFQFTITLSGNRTLAATVDYDTQAGTATSPEDYTFTSGTETFLVGQDQRTVTVQVHGDTTLEDDETFTVHLSGATGAGITDADGVGTIVNDDAVPAISVTDDTVAEGDSGITPSTFTISLSNPSEDPVTVDYATSDGSATSPADYSPASGTLAFASGQTSKTVTVAVAGDTAYEGDETFTLNLSNANSASIADSQAHGGE